ncbi:hypothetical protein TNIN_116431 [Trichonephila inaurata madagascariensis]|uniref:Uncharacterized protein n=1 Tax=Trichonephila inaurata madagascariensis TaxID=2747483 RepID=A0A8X6YF80_9ARAC|nr:hypothetical protein TNIN_116431 [Trichonephila inaurata madagascariensis]
MKASRRSPEVRLVPFRIPTPDTHGRNPGITLENGSHGSIDLCFAAVLLRRFGVIQSDTRGNGFPVDGMVGSPPE